MKRNLGIVLLFLAILFVMSGCGASSNVSGTIRSALTNLLVSDGVNVYLNDVPNPVSGGQFVFTDLKNGTYNLRVTATGFETYTRTFTVPGTNHLEVGLVSKVTPVLDTSWEVKYGGATGNAYGLLLKDGYLFIASNAEILRYTPSGTASTPFVTGIPTYPNPLAEDPDGDVWAVSSAGTVYHYNSSGGVVESFASVVGGYTKWGLAVDSTHFYVTDLGDNKVKKFARSNGALVAEQTQANSINFSSPCQLKFGPDGKLYVTDLYNHRIVVMNTNLVVQSTIECLFSGETLAYPLAMCFGPDGCIYVHDRTNYSIKKISTAGVHLVKFSTTNYLINGLAVDSFGNIYVSDNISPSKIWKYHWDRGIVK